MNLEISLVKVPSIDAKVSRLLSRNRYIVEDDTTALDSIGKFIADNASTFNAAIMDKRLVAQMQDLSKLTINDLNCLRYVLSSKGMDLWYYYVSDVEVNKDGIPEGLFEYNIVDSCNMMNTLFIPFSSKLLQSQQDNKLTILYKKILDMYDLFSGEMFSSMNNPIKSAIESMKVSEDALGVVPTTQSTYVNSIFEFLGKDIRVITN